MSPYKKKKFRSSRPEAFVITGTFSLFCVFKTKTSVFGPEAVVVVKVVLVVVDVVVVVVNAVVVVVLGVVVGHTYSSHGQPFGHPD